MTHPSGIRAEQEVLSEFAVAHDDATRALEVVIENERLVIKRSSKKRRSWEKDYDPTVLPLLEESSPCYIFYKLDSKSQFGNDWLLINWVPDKSTVRDKMLYASTRSTIRKQFGDHLIKEDISGNSVTDVNLNGFERHLASKSAPAPLTNAEREKAEILNNEMTGGFYGSRQTLGAVNFGLSPEGFEVVKSFSSGNFQYVQLGIDIDKEVIVATVSAKKLEPEGIAGHTPDNEGRYHLYRFAHHVNGKPRSALFFIHSISGYQSSVKSRMLYSSCKSALIARLEQELSLHFDSRLETDNMKEMTTEFLLEKLYPKPPEEKLTFSKPHGPAGRRPRSQKP
ncbi:unnamed protein product [Calicophoron daubneyi]|uniref:Twinfilin n=1 Tax=Calicophoron daubneyi TaxID=300641 RepID=A0AAV2T0V9_CALDB